MHPVRFLVIICGLFLLFSFGIAAEAQKVEYLTATPLVERIHVQARPVNDAGEMPLYLIAWGADVATVYTQGDDIVQTENIFKKYGLNFKLKAEDNFSKQVESCLRGETPYLRGTMDMITEAAEVFERQGIHLQVVVQITWSVGGDVMVVRPHIKSAKDIKTIALQLDGPHMYYAPYVLKSAGANLGNVKFRFLQELTLSKFDTGGKIIDPVSAFQNDSSLDAVMCISPDADMLTKITIVDGKKRATEGAVFEARKYVTTKDAPKIIADVYAVRSDYASANPEKVKAFHKAILEGQKQWVDLMKTKSIKYNQVVSKSADILMGSATATADIEGMILDCQYVGAEGNVAFFTGRGTTRTLATLSSEIQSSLKEMGLLTGSVSLAGPAWDVAALLGVSADAMTAQSALPTASRFDPKKTAVKIERQIEAEPDVWKEEGTLFEKEVFFDREQEKFPEARYADAFMVAFKSIEAYGGALVTIEGHVDVKGLIRAREKAKQTKTPVDIAIASAVEGRGKTLSYQRAEEVKKTFLAFCRKQGFKLDDSQFIVIGMGAKSPKISDPSTPEDSAENRRVTFRIKSVEVE